MKVHITNSYGYVKEKTEEEKRVAKVARTLGFFEMGLYTYDVSSDSEAEISKRLDGIIASVEVGDIVIMQFPTGNGVLYEERLLQKICAYSHNKVITIWHDQEYYCKHKGRYSEYIETECLIENIDSFLDVELASMLVDAVVNSEGMDRQLEEKTDCYYDKEYIHIGFGLHDKFGDYSVWVGTAMQSIIEHTDEKLCFHILHDNTLRDENREKLICVANSGGEKIEFHVLDVEHFIEVKEMMGYFTIGTMFRLLLPDILPQLNRIIYLDADLFVNTDIKELWNIDISNYCIAAVRDAGTLRGHALPYPVRKNQMNRNEYFNSGVLYINLANVRKNGDMKKKVVDYLKENPDAMCPDQDALNVVYRGKCLYLDESWNYFISEMRKEENVLPNQKIYHYAGATFVLYYQNQVEELYYETVLRTPWGQGEGRKLMRKSMGRIWDRAEQLQELLGQISAQNKQYVFYGEMNYAMKNMMALLGVDPTCYRCENRFEKLLLGEKEKNVIFVLPQADNGEAIGILEQHGLKNRVDYFVIPCLLSAEEGGYVC